MEDKKDGGNEKSNINFRDKFCYTCIFTIGIAIPVLLNNQLIEKGYDGNAVLATSLVYLTSSIILRVMDYVKFKKCEDVNSITVNKWYKLELFSWSLAFSSLIYYFEMRSRN